MEPAPRLPTTPTRPRPLVKRITHYVLRITHHVSRNIHVNTLCNTNPSIVHITHAAHPLQGCCVPIRRVLERGGGPYLLIERPDGRTQCIPQAWTNQAPPVLATPGACFTPPQLQALCRWRDAHLDKLAIGSISPTSSNSGGAADEYSHRPVPSDGGVVHSVPGSPPTSTGSVESLGSTPLDESTSGNRRKP
jgi:hypothetical protein